MNSGSHPHANNRLVKAGATENARAGVILLHGRGGAPEDILSLVPHIDPGGVAYWAPEAAGNTWYPLSFLSPLEANQPWLDSALRRLDEVVAAIRDEGVPEESLVLMGFSQGACLALEYACRHARRFGGLVGLSGGVIGPEVERERYSGSLEGTPAFLGCSDVDPHIPLERVHATTEVLRGLGAEVDERIYPGMGHLVNEDELRAAEELLRRVALAPG